MTYRQEVESNILKKYSGGAIGFSGPPGTGKTTIGKIVAEKLQMPFYDLDDLITKKTHVKTTRDIINNDGLSQFKQIQNVCLKEFIHNHKEQYVLSFGGIVNHTGHDPRLTNGNRTLIRFRSSLLRSLHE